MKKIPMVNYIKVFLISVTTVFIVLVLSNVYLNKKHYELANDDIMGFLATIKFDEINEYLVENVDGFIYIASSADTTLDTFELKLKEYILGENLEEDFVYLDSSLFSGDMFDELKKLYFAPNVSSVNLGDANLFSVHNGKITAVLNIDVENFEEVKSFINVHEVIE